MPLEEALSIEYNNFTKAGEILDEIWSAVCIEGHVVITKYIDPSIDTLSVPDLPTEEWYIDRVRERER